MGTSIRFGQLAGMLQPAAASVTSTPPQVRFGRDEVFERNDRFEKLADADQGPIGALKEVLAKSKPSLAEVRSASAVLYNEQGRVRGKSAVALAVQAAQKEVEVAKETKASPVEQALSQVKLSNAELAEDRNNPQAFDRLDEALKALKKEGFKPTAEQRPFYAHGVYNRGTYFMSNDLYKETARTIGPIEMALSDAVHEGLTLYLRDDSPVLPKVVPGLEDGLPYIDQAIALSEQMDDKKIARAEYYSAKGEALHLLAHMKMNRPGGIEHEKDALEAFKQAMSGLESIPVSEQTARHSKLIEKIGTVKIPHLCNHPHEVQYTGPGCAVEQTRAQVMMDAVSINGVPVAPDNEHEAEGKRVKEENRRLQERMDRLYEEDPAAYRMAALRYRMGLPPFDD